MTTSDRNNSILTPVVLVDQNDNPIGLSDKLAAHKEGLLHRAISVFVFRNSGEALVQRRALQKYHSAGLWSNTCCSHPYPNETPAEAAKRRLKEEMGLTCDLQFLFTKQYRAEVPVEMIENEFVHVFRGISELEPLLNPDEAMDYRWEAPEAINKDMYENPGDYTAWFKLYWMSSLTN